MYDVAIIGAGAAGLMCAIEAGRRGRRVLVLDKANKPGKKILMSGGGRCNFTNYYIEPEKYISHNPHFCKSALSRYTQWDFIHLVEQHRIPYYEKTQGQLFCQHRSSDILDMLLAECQAVGVTVLLKQDIVAVEPDITGFKVQTSKVYHVASLVVASGGLSIPTMGASPFGYQLAEQFGHQVYPTRAGLVPFTLHDSDKVRFDGLSGVSLPCTVQAGGQSFDEMMLFTHRGLSGPAMLQISSYWQAGDALDIDWLQHQTLDDIVEQNSGQSVRNALGAQIPKRLLAALFDDAILEKLDKQLLPDESRFIENRLKQFSIKPNNTEGYRTAEVTIGGVNCDEISSKTMMSLKHPGLYFIGEVLDVTGWLGGYNFQWAWSSGWAAGQVV